jgi:ketosteroid isomerase-like protein
MSEEIKSAIRDSVKAIIQSDLAKLLSFFAEDATLVVPEGAFNGREEIKRYWNWQLHLVTEKKAYRDRGRDYSAGK